MVDYRWAVGLWLGILLSALFAAVAIIERTLDESARHPLMQYFLASDVIVPTATIKPDYGTKRGGVAIDLRSDLGPVATRATTGCRFGLWAVISQTNAVFLFATGHVGSSTMAFRVGVSVFCWLVVGGSSRSTTTCLD